MSFNIDKLLRHAKAEIKAGRAAAARVSILTALETYPTNMRLLDQLAETQAAATRLPIRPFGAAQMTHFQNTRSTLGLEAAIEEIAAAVQLNPASPWAQGVLGGALLEAGLFPAAVKHLRLALKLDPKYIEAGFNLANALHSADKIPQAIDAIEDVLKQSADLPRALSTKARLLALADRDSEAIDTFTRYLALEPTDFSAIMGKSACLFKLNKLDQAELPLRDLLRAAPNNGKARGILGNILLAKGLVDEAISEFETTLQVSPRSAKTFYNLSRAKDFTPDDPLVKSMVSLANDPTLAIDEQAALHFGLAKAYEDFGDFDTSFAHLKKGNDLRAAEANYKVETDRILFADLLQRFSPSAPALAPEPAARRPLFVLGMMRSGTTLMEQILSSHPQVHGAGELEVLPRLITTELNQTPAGPLDQAALSRIRHGYLAALEDEPGTHPVVVDKLPANFRFIGLIQKAFPEARIVHMRRDPVAVCWSVYKTYFTHSTIGYAHTLQDTMDYYDLYEKMMADWRLAYPQGFLDVDYEGLTRTPEPVIRAVLDYCGLSFDPACLSPQDNRRAVQTASLRQVRSGIYQGSSKKWRAFDPYLAPLKAHFGQD
ncbi:MAG: sulfotransferase [Pseudomonadota bacterium]